MKRNIGFAFTGSFCTFEKTIIELQKLSQKYNIYPIMSFNSSNLDTKFGKTVDFKNKIESICNNKIIDTIQDAEPLGPQKIIDLLVIAPCSGNTIAKLANDIIDTPVTMACKSTLRNDYPIVLGISTNNGLSRSCRKYWKTFKSKTLLFYPI